MEKQNISLLNEVIESSAERALESLRLRLLDLTARNRLINFRHTKRGSLRIIDELPDQLVDTLIVDDKEMRFLPVPDPTEEELIEAGYLRVNEETQEIEQIKKTPTAVEWAKRFGIATDYEVPELTNEGDDKHTDSAIQTLWYPNELEGLLKSLSQTAESAIQEMGANILFLGFGFLEWYESPDSDAARLAPLYLMPATINRGRLDPQTRTYQYTLSYSGEDIIANLSLREKLRFDFGMALPEIDEATTPEEYFRDVQALIEKAQPRWQVKRNISLVLLNFSKLLMYLDLDPARWPEDAKITDHPIVSQFLKGYGGEPETDKSSSDLSFGEEYIIDDLKTVHDDYPLIDDADSSQHSALIDAVDGKNLVIEGPPGTGKSQTITNLIAAAAAQGKRVLFVAEKLAALEVVKARLDKAGLGEFCLELHSHKSQKRKVLDEIEERLKKHRKYQSPTAIQIEIDRYEELKDQLRVYAETINRHWKKTGKSKHEIFTAATRYRNELGLNPADYHPLSLNGDSLDLTTQHRCRDQVSAFTKTFKAVAAQLQNGTELQDHPWYGVRNTDLQVFDADSVSTLIERWQASLNTLLQERDAFRQQLSFAEVKGIESLHDVEALLNEIKALPKLRGDELLDRVPVLHGRLLQQCKKLYKHLKNIDEQFGELALSTDVDVLKNLDTVEQFVKGNEELQKLVGGDVELGRLVEAINRLTALDDQLMQLDEPLHAIVSGVGGEAGKYLNTSHSGLVNLSQFVQLSSGLAAQYWEQRDPLFENEALDQVLPALRQDLTVLRDLHGKLDGVFSLDKVPPKAEVLLANQTLEKGGLFGFLKSGWRAAKKQVLGYAVNPQVGLSSIRPLLTVYADYAEQIKSFQENSHYTNALGKKLDGLNTDTEALEHLRAWYRKVRQVYGRGFGPKVFLADALFSMPPSLGRAIQSLNDQGVNTQIADLLDDLGSLRIVFSPVQKLRDESVELGGETGLAKELLDSVNLNLKSCRSLLNDQSLSMENLADRIEALVRVKASVDLWDKTGLDDQIFAGRLGIVLEPGLTRSPAFLKFKHTLEVAHAFEKYVNCEPVKQFFRDEPTADRYAAIRRQTANLSERYVAQSQDLAAFSERTKLIAADWIGEQRSLEDTIKRNESALDNRELMANWLDYVRAREQIEAIGLVAIADGLEQKAYDTESTEVAYFAGLYDLLAREIIHEEPQLGQFSGHSQEAIQDQFREYDQKLKTLQCQKIAWKIDQAEVPDGIQSARVKELTERRLLERECAKKTRHIPIRQLLVRSGQALVGLKPIFMMGPMSVAQYIAPGRIKFDLVVMDEASQIKPQDALGAIARGGQLVVVGDPKQLPPTSFFDRVVENDMPEDEVIGLQESESILDATLPIFHSRRLRWHYRSQHESLIAFSNHSFYDGDLVLFPSPHKQNAEFGIQYLRVERGCFVNRKNTEEAKVIAEAVREHFQSRPDESVGVVAMSADQRQQIEARIEALAKEDMVFQEQLERDAGKSESLFVKNLENVQGDERDVIMISMTYGPSEPGGRIFQRFGPINSDMGWRRLNVLFTRSKKRMAIFSSMRSDDVLISASSKRGVRALRDFLSYCETGILHQTTIDSGRSPDSDFEVAVMRELQKEGFECVPQVGVAGFFIDVAVIDPGNPSRFLMGIECDGATYHSAKSVRDRDRLRQAVLERLGWRIRRIWSTDWFKNPAAQLVPIVRELRDLQSTPPAETPQTPDLRLVEQSNEDDIEIKDQTDHIAFIYEGSLRDKLERFNQDVILRDQPGGDAKGNLLRPSMLEALIEFKPTSKEEFLERIPHYLRQSINVAEAKYLDQVFDIINADLDGD